MTDPIRVEGVTLPDEGHGVRIMAGSTPIALFRVGGRLMALHAVCTHVGGPLDRGTIVDGAVQCPWHGSRFALDTGQVKQGPATRPVRAYTVETEGNTVVLHPIG